MLSRIIVLVSAVVFFTSCSEFNKIQKSESFEVRYEGAKKYYEAKDYYRANVLYGSLLAVVKHKDEAEEVQIKYAYCQYYEDQYTMSAHYFKKFYQTYPTSSYVEEAYYMYAMSLYAISPPHHLDQSNTQMAIDAFEVFLNKYKETEYKEACNEKVDLLQARLEYKAYNTAYLQYKIGNFKAAVRVFDNFYKDYPSSKHNEELAYLKIDSQFNLAEISREVDFDANKKKIKLKEVRYSKVKEFYYNFVDMYPNSSYSKDAEKLYQESQKRIAELHKS